MKRSKSNFLRKPYVCLSAFLLVLTMVCTTLSSAGITGFAATQDQTLNSLNRKFKPETANANEASKNARDVSVKIAEEGMVLLKNNGALPLSVAIENKITVFGKGSVAPIYAGSGSGGSGAVTADVYSSLRDAGFEVNPTVKAFYENNELSGAGRSRQSQTGCPVGETPAESYTAEVKNSFKEYSNAAIVFLSRAGGEGNDLPTSSYTTSEVDGKTVETLIPGRESKDEHYLQLDKNERDMIKMATDNFDKVIVLLNCGMAMEIGELEANEKVDSVLWTGDPGGHGFEALGKLLNGSVTPSGKTTDIYAADFKKDPTWQNFAWNVDDYKRAQTNNQYTHNGEETKYRTVEYEEGIYIGYRYYETRGFVEGGNWYDDNVVYPFGYGLSYTEFKWDVSFKSDKTLKKDSTITAQVKVTNVGEYAGKDVVELYYSAPYLSGEIEKSHVVLGAFAKTKLLQPGESDVVMLQLDAYSMASYDYNDANVNGFSGWELDKGDYNIYVGKDSHDAWTNGTKSVVTVAENIKFDTDTTTGYKVENRFDNVSEHFKQGKSTIMSRSDFEGTFPTYVDKKVDLVMDNDTFNTVELKSNEVAATGDKESDPWYTATMPKQAADTSAKNVIKLAELSGLNYDDPKWDAFMDQLTVAELAAMVGTGYYQINEIIRLGIPGTTCFDGPAGFINDRGYLLNFFPTESLLASTWNTELAEEEGKAIAEESLWANEAGMYAMATNTHRSPFGGRNYEYYSEDSLLAGKMCAAISKSMTEKGMITFVKHFALNDQETNRDTTSGILTWANEQSMREIYFKSFEIAVKEGKTNGIMSSFNRIGLTPSAENYDLLTEVLRNEWGFKGSVVTDFGDSMNAYVNINTSVRAGNDIWLGYRTEQVVGSGSDAVAGIEVTATQVAALRKSAKNSLYCVANSLAMNRIDSYGSEYQREDFDFCQDAFGMVSLGHNGRIGLPAKGGITGWLRPEGAPAGMTYIPGTGLVPTPAEDPDHLQRGEQVEVDFSSKIFGTDGSVKYVGEGFPEGLSVDPVTGVLKGKVSLSAPDGYYLASITLYTADGRNLGQCLRVQMTIYNQLEGTPDEVVKAMYYTGETVINATKYVELSANVSVAGGIKQVIADDAGAWGRRIFVNKVKTPVTYSISKGTLPEGLWLNTYNGTINGKTTAAAGEYKVTVKAVSAEDGVDPLEQEITINVSNFGSLSYNACEFNHKVEKGSELNLNVATAYGSDAINYTASGLPAGVTLNENGTLVGTPTVAGTFTVTITASSYGYESASATYVIEVVEQAKTPENPGTDKSSESAEDNKNGCNSEIDVTSYVAFAGIILLAAAATMFIRTRKKDN